jgi:hypothetical protein
MSKIKVNGQLTGMRGVYQVAAELSRLGFIVSPTSRSAIGADLLVTDQKCKKAFSVQVKTNSKGSTYWLVGEKAKGMVSKSHIYVLVNFCKDRQTGSDKPFYWIVPSRVISTKMTSKTSVTGKGSTFHSISAADISGYADKWSLFGNPNEIDA